MNLINHIVRTGLVTAPPNETGPVQRLQIQLNPREVTDQVNSMGLYGVASSPLPGAAVMVLNVGGNNSNGTVVATNDSRWRPVGMTPGEVQLYTNKAQQIYLSQSGGVVSIIVNGGQQVNVIASESITATAPTVTVNGNLVVNGTITSTGDIKAGTVTLETHTHTGVQGGTGSTGLPVG